MFPAFTNGLFFRSPPAAIPTVALHEALTALNTLDGSFITVFPGPCETIIPKVPEPLTSFPPSLGIVSILNTGVPSGIFPNGSTFPISKAAFCPISKASSVVMLSEARKAPFVPSSNSTFVIGAFLAGS